MDFQRKIIGINVVECSIVIFHDDRRLSHKTHWQIFKNQFCRASLISALIVMKGVLGRSSCSRKRFTTALPLSFLKFVAVTFSVATSCATQFLVGNNTMVESILCYSYDNASLVVTMFALLAGRIVARYEPTM